MTRISLATSLQPFPRCRMRPGPGRLGRCWTIGSQMEGRNSKSPEAMGGRRKKNTVRNTTNLARISCPFVIRARTPECPSLYMPDGGMLQGPALMRSLVVLVSTTFILAERPDPAAASTQVDTIPSIPISSSSRQPLILPAGQGFFCFQASSSPRPPLPYFSNNSSPISLSLSHTPTLWPGQSINLY